MRPTRFQHIFFLMLLPLVVAGVSCSKTAPADDKAKESSVVPSTPEEKVAECTFFRMELEESTIASVPLDDYEVNAFARITGLDTLHYSPHERAEKILQRNVRGGYRLAAYHLQFGNEGTQAEQYFAVYDGENHLTDALLVGYWGDFRDLLKMPNDSADIQQRFAEDLYCTIVGDSIMIDRNIWYSLNNDSDEFGGKITTAYTIDEQGHFVQAYQRSQNMPKLNAIALRIMQLSEAPISTPDLGQMWTDLENAAMSATPTAATYRQWYTRYRTKANAR